MIVLAPGTLLHHRYEIIRPLGGGGFSQVFEVRDGDAIKVLKILDLNEFSPSQQQKAIELFRREADFLSHFQHRGVPQVEPNGYFIWQCDPPTAAARSDRPMAAARSDRPTAAARSGRAAPLHCLVMEKIPGMNLQEWLQQGQAISVRQMIDWLHQLVEILIPLHQQQFFHRDIKPSNIMLRPDGQLILIDFGTVREVSVTYLVKQEQQETGTAIISAGYTPPEQAEGQAVPQSDFFALGRTLVTLLTSKPPIDLPVDPQTGQLQWHSFAENVPPQFADLIDRLMAPFPGQRPQSGEVILQTIRQLERKLDWEQRLPVLQKVDRFRTKLDRRLFQLTPFKTVLLLVLLFGGSTLWQDREDISDWVNNWGFVARQEDRNDLAWLAFQLALLFNRQNAAALFNLGDLHEQFQQLEQAELAYQAALSNYPENYANLTPKIYNNLARLKIRREDFTGGMALIRAGFPDAETRESKYALLKNQGWAELGLKQFAKAQETLQAAIEINPEAGAAYCLIGQVYDAQNQFDRALDAYKKCLLISRPDSDEIQWIDRAQNSVQRLEERSPP